MKQRNVILVDQDNVIADFDGRFLELWRKKFPDLVFIAKEKRVNFYIKDDYPPELHDYITSIYLAKGFIESLKPIPGAIKALKEMKKAGLEVKICTTPLSRIHEQCIAEKRNWVEKNLGTEWLNDILFTNDKTVLEGDYLIDDKPLIMGAKKPTWVQIIFDKPYNRHIQGQLRLKRWKDWKKILKTI